MPLAREGRPGGFRGWVGCGEGSDSPSRAGAAGLGEISRREPADRRFGGCRTQFQLEKKKKKLNCPAPSNRCVSRGKLRKPVPKRSVPLLPAQSTRWVPAVGPGRSRPGGSSRQGRRWWRVRGRRFPCSASPPPLGAHRRLLLRPRGAPLRRRRSWRLGREGPLRASAGVSQVSRRAGPGFLPGARGGHSGRQTSREAPVGCGAARGAKSTPTPADFRLQRGGWRRAARVPSRLETPPAAIRHARPAPLGARGFLVCASCWGSLVYASPGGSA